MTFDQILIGNYNSGLVTNKKPFLLNENAFSQIENAYVWRERVKKRNGLNLIGQLRRVLTSQSLGMTSLGVTTYTFTNVFTTIGISGETNATIQPGSVLITIGAPDNATFTDLGNGLFSVTGVGVSAGSSINYSTGKIVIVISAAIGGASISINIDYFPGLPVMGIWQQESSLENEENTIFFDEKYAYQFIGSIYNTGSGFQELIPGTTWHGNDTNFFWATNWRDVTNGLLFFVTNFTVPTLDPPRYLQGSSWNSFTPAISSTQNLWQARIFIPYYGRLLAFNTWEGATAAGAQNIPNRCRFSQIGNPLQSDAWRSDIFGKGGFIDAPTSENIVSATFFKNTLIVGFERSTWTLRYVGDYGLPFIWERISSDFGTESQFSSILFDQGVFSVGDRAIVSSDATTVQRIDTDIPDQVFQFRNINNGTFRVNGIRDFQKELVFWTYRDDFFDPLQTAVFPNKVLVYNYRNNTYANFRENITVFGTFQDTTGVSWDSTNVFWDDESVTWDDVGTAAQFPSIVTGNQMGYVHVFEETTTVKNERSLSILGITLGTTTSVTLFIPNHNLADGEAVFMDNLMFLDSSLITVLPTNLNGVIYQANQIDKDHIYLELYNPTINEYQKNFSYTPVSSAIYIGGGTLALLPKMNIQTKDFNPYAQKGMQFKISHIDFMMDASETAAVSVQMFLNSFLGKQANLLLKNNINQKVANQEVETSLPTPYYIPQSTYAWHRFYATLAGQYLRLGITYDDALMNQVSTHEQAFELNSMILYVKPGGKIIF